MDFQTTLHEAIKNRLVEVRSNLEFGNGDSLTRKLYYLARLEDNLVEPMSERHLSEYRKGSGGELEWKMSSIRSSSAMTFNLLGNGPVVIREGDLAGRYEVEYEYQLPTLKGNPHPANLDAYLKGEGADIYCEMKMLEWLGAAHHGLRNAYLEEEGYLLSRDEAGAFADLFRQLARVGTEANGGKGEWIADGRYDSLQMAKHLLAICNKVALTSGYRPDRIVLLNCVWEMTDTGKLGRYEGKYLRMLAEEHEGFEAFRDAALPKIRPLFESKGINLDIRYVAVPEMIESLELAPKHAEYLSRYIV